MAWFKKSSAYSSRYYRRPRTYKRRSNLQQRAAAQQKDSLTVVIKYDFTGLSIPLAANSNSNVAVTSVYNMLRSSPMYNSFASMYDQMCLKKVTIKAVQEASNSSIQSPTNPITVITAFDRNGVSTNAAGNLVYPSFDDTSSYSSAFTKQAFYGTTYSSTRVLYPSTIEEKGQWIATSRLQSLPVNTDQSQPHSVIESPQYRFKPCYIIGIRSVTAPQAPLDNAFQVGLSCQFVVTFRGLRNFSASKIVPAN